MGQLKHFLGGLACKYFARTPRRARAGAQPAAKAVERRRKHLDRCTACRSRQQRERQYLERLRGAAVPAASDDLTARLLARTGALAGQDGDGAASEGRLPSVRPRRDTPRPGRPVRLAARIAGALAASAVLTGGAAYLVGGDAARPADDAFSSAFPARDAAGPALSAGTVAGAAWKLSGGPDVAPAGALSSAQLSALRSRGWACPELRDLGYHLVWARGGVAAGSEVLELRLTDGRHFATVLEQHDAASAAGQPPAGARPAGVPPVNVLTGHPAAEDGFVPARLDEVAPAGAAALPPGSLWVNRQAPFRAIYRTPAATFTYISEFPPEQADDGVGALVQPGPDTAPADLDAGGLSARLGRGLERIAELIAR